MTERWRWTTTTTTRKNEKKSDTAYSPHQTR